MKKKFATFLNIIFVGVGSVIEFNIKSNDFVEKP